MWLSDTSVLLLAHLWWVLIKFNTEPGSSACSDRRPPATDQSEQPAAATGNYTVDAEYIVRLKKVLMGISGGRVC